jgi:hypothetical protein
MKSLGDAMALRNRLIEHLEEADTECAANAGTDGGESVGPVDAMGLSGCRIIKDKGLLFRSPPFR